MYSIKVFLCFAVIIAVCDSKKAKKTRLDEFYESAEAVMMAVDPYEYIVYENENLPKMVKNLFVTMLTEMTIFFYKSDITQPVILNFTSSFNASHYFQFEIDPQTWTELNDTVEYINEDGEMTMFEACFLGPICDKNPVPLVVPLDNLEIYGPDAPALLRIFIKGINVRRNEHPKFQQIVYNPIVKRYNFTTDGRKEVTCLFQLNYEWVKFWSMYFRYEPVRHYTTSKAYVTLVMLRYFIFVVLKNKYGNQPEQIVFIPFKDEIFHALANGVSSEKMGQIIVEAAQIHAFQCDDEGGPFKGNL
uniref:Secreted protein n=1 Tax=Panagrellus redivivus TaxID=6233 RepID=A0A7E5A0I4_PANRE